MTILVAVKTGAAAIIAADSKVSTSAVVGKNPDGSPRWVPQTYDHAVKLTKDASGTAIAAFAGNGNIGEQNAADYFSRVVADLHCEPDDQDARVQSIAKAMSQARIDVAARLGVAIAQLPETVVLLAAAPKNGIAPRFWRLELKADDAKIDEILQAAGVWFEGNADIAFALMYGALPAFEEGLRSVLGVDPTEFQAARSDSLDKCPIQQINFWTMPVQDAINFSAFVANAQVEMDKFRPGTAVCGGPIDLMILEMAPMPTIRSFPGKSLHHPATK